MARSAYVALYKAVMNINEDGHQPHGWHGLEGNQWIKCDTPTETSDIVNAVQPDEQQLSEEKQRCSQMELPLT